MLTTLTMDILRAYLTSMNKIWNHQISSMTKNLDVPSLITWYYMRWAQDPRATIITSENNRLFLKLLMADFAHLGPRNPQLWDPLLLSASELALHQPHHLEARRIDSPEFTRQNWNKIYPLVIQHGLLENTLIELYLDRWFSMISDWNRNFKWISKCPVWLYSRY